MVPSRMMRGSDVPRARIARSSASCAGVSLGQRVERAFHHLGDVAVRLAMACQDRLDGETVELEDLLALSRDGADLRPGDRLAGELFRRHWRPDDQGPGAQRDRGRVRHVVEMAVADDDGIRPLHFRRGKAERGIVAAAIDEGVEQDDLVAVGELEIGKAGPAHHQGMRVVRGRPAGRHEPRLGARRVGGRGGELRIGIDGIEARGTRIGERTRQGRV
jgi:hypothetical protein